MKFTSIITAILSMFLVLSVTADELPAYQDRPEVIEFIEMMNSKHGSDKEELKNLFSSANFQERVIRIMNRQPEGTMTWSKYKAMLVTDERVDSGKQFIDAYKQDLMRAEDIYGVPAEIIASIIGIETKYGRITGNIRVLDSLTTLSFDYPRRSKFFKIQLEEFLLLTQEEGLDPSKVKGSIAGAMGFGQFMPDSYRNYAVDFDFDGKRDILNNPVDSIGSVANFLNKKGKWEPNTEVVVAAELTGERPDIRTGFSPYITISDLKSLGLKPITTRQASLNVIPVELQLQLSEEEIKEKLLSMALSDNRITLLYELGSLTKIFFPFNKLAKEAAEKRFNESDREKEYFEYWLGLSNYKALSRYNRSKLYIMAVYEFSESLAEFL